MSERTSHIKNILEALRGKTVIDSIIFSYDQQATDDLEDGIRNELIDDSLTFKLDFLTYAQWNYFDSMVSYIGDLEEPDVVSIQTHQVLGREDEQFKLVFRRNDVIFDGRQHIEDTLFLDIERYLQHNDVSYEVLSDE